MNGAGYFLIIIVALSALLANVGGYVHTKEIKSLQAQVEEIQQELRDE